MKIWFFRHSTGFLNCIKCPYKQWYIAGSTKYSMKPLSNNEQSPFRGGVHHMLEYIQSRSLSLCNRKTTCLLSFVDVLEIKSARTVLLFPQIPSSIGMTQTLCRSFVRKTKRILPRSLNFTFYYIYMMSFRCFLVLTVMQSFPL